MLPAREKRPGRGAMSRQVAFGAVGINATPGSRCGQKTAERPWAARSPEVCMEEGAWAGEESGSGNHLQEVLGRSREGGPCLTAGGCTSA